MRNNKENNKNKQQDLIFLGIKGVHKSIKNKFASIAKDKGMLQAALFEEVFLYYMDTVLGIKVLDTSNGGIKDDIPEP